MNRILVSRQANEDAYNIWAYIADDNLSAADRWVESINNVYEMLARHTKLGPARYDLGKDLRYFPMGSYLILYREIENGIEIVRVLHGARNLDAVFMSDE